MSDESKFSQIWAIYDKHGGAISLDRLTRIAIAEGVWDAEESASMVFVTARRVCHTALRQKSPTGLPLAGSTRKQDDDGDTLWIQLQLWDFDDALHNLRLRLRQTTLYDWPTIERLHQYVLDRFGAAPPIPRIVMDDPEAPLWWLDDDDDDDEENPPHDA